MAASFYTDRSMPEYAAIMERLKPTIAGVNIREVFMLRASDGLVIISTDPNQEGKYLDNQPFFTKGRHGHPAGDHDREHAID